MPTFTAIALDSLLEPGHSKSMVTARNVPDPRVDKRKSVPNSRYDDWRRSASSSKLDSESRAPTIGLDRRNSNPAIRIDRQHHGTGISPALYATPQSTPLPDSPSSYPPSPYIINHKRRGPRLLKCMSQNDVAVHQCATDGKDVETAIDAEKHVVTAHGDDGLVPKEDNSVKDYNLSVTADKPGKEDPINDTSAEEDSVLNLDCSSAAENGIRTSMSFDLQRNSEVGNSFDFQDSMSIKSNADSKNNGGLKHAMSSSIFGAAEFYDACEEISSDNEPQPVTRDLEAELSEIKLSLLEEIEKQKQAEEALNHMRMQWQRIREQLLPIGLTLPAAPVTVEEDRHLDDAVKNMIDQLYVARFVSNSMGRGMAKAEAEEEMEGQIELKNFEIGRLWDKLHYYEAVNREMSQRNQEAVDTARRLRQRRKRMVRWIWGSVAASLTIGSAVLAWSYISAGRGSSYSGQSETSDSGSVTQSN